MDAEIQRLKKRLAELEALQEALAADKPRARLSRKDPRTGRFLPTDPEKRRIALASPVRKGRIVKPKRLTKKELEGREFRTRVRTDFLFIAGETTPCKALSFIQYAGIGEDGLRTLRESLYAASVAFAASAETGFQGNPPPPWLGTATTHGICAVDIAGFLHDLSTDAKRPEDVQRAVRKLVRNLADRLGVRIAGEITVSYREVVKFRNRYGEERVRMDVVPSLPSHRFILGEKIKKMPRKTDGRVIPGAGATGSGGFIA